MCESVYMNVCIYGVTCVLRQKINIRCQSSESIQTVCFCLLACFFVLFWYRISHWYMWLPNLARTSSPWSYFPISGDFWKWTIMPGFLQIYTTNILSTETSPCLLRKYFLAMHRVGLGYSTLSQHFPRRCKTMGYTPISSNK